MQRLAAAALSGLRYRRLWAGCGLAFVGLVIYLSLAPTAPEIGTVGEIKLGHVAAYAWLMFWFAQVMQTLARRVAVAIALVAMGIALEFLQGMTGYRTFAVADMVSNGIGVLLGLLLGHTAAGRALALIDARLVPPRKR